MKRYDDIPVKVSENNKRVVRSTIYPPIPRTINDIYVITGIGDRLDLLAYKYYGAVAHWWILAEANAIGKGSLTIPAGTQLRIPDPNTVNDIIYNFRELNK